MGQEHNSSNWESSSSNTWRHHENNAIHHSQIDTGNSHLKERFQDRSKSGRKVRKEGVEGKGRKGRRKYEGRKEGVEINIGRI
jgi:hypothetical protein